MLLAQHVFEQYICWRRRKRLERRGVSDDVRAALPHVDEREYARAQRYASRKNNFGFAADAYVLVVEATLLVSAPALWNGPASWFAVEGLGLTPQHELARMACSMLLMCPLELLSKLSVSAYSSFAIEEEYGFNKHTARS